MGLDQALRSNFWVVVLSMLGGAAYFGAQGVGNLVAAGMLVDEELLALPAPSDKAPALQASPVAALKVAPEVPGATSPSRTSTWLPAPGVWTR